MAEPSAVAGAAAGESTSGAAVAVAVTPETPVMTRPDEVRPGVPRVSPLRAEARPVPGPSTALPTIAPRDPIPTYVEPEGLSEAIAAGGPETDDEPALPDEARDRVAMASEAPTSQIESGPGQVLHVRFGGAAPDRLILAMEAIRSLFRERPGATRVVLHVPGPNGAATLPMELSRTVAYDADLLAEVRRRVGDGLVDLRLA
jgi:hypothetical protein